MTDYREIYRAMCRSRAFEVKIQELFSKKELRGTTHLNIGQEASHVALIDALEDDDWIVPTHRHHGFTLTKGASMEAMFSELLGSAEGLGKGLCGSMHMSDKEHHNFGSTAVVGSSVPLALGISFALKRQNKANISVAIFGDGATSRGVVHESMNLASVWRLPLLFYLENNHYGMSASEEKVISTRDISRRAEGYNISYLKVDGNDYDAVFEASQKARAYILENQRPFFLEVNTYRMCGHSKSDKLVYRSRGEEEEWRAKDPLERIKAKLEAPEAEKIEAEAKWEVENAWQKAKKSYRDITEEELNALVYAPYKPSGICESGMHSATGREALKEALTELFDSDDRVVMIGEDIGRYGGCFGVTRGLYDKYAPRLYETPVSEETFTDFAVSAAALGERPIVELMYGDFATLASDGLVNHGAKLRFMSAGAFNCPMVLRAPSGPLFGYGAQHSQSLESLFLNVPGLKIVAPSDPFTLKALLKEAVKDENPVVFIESKTLYEAEGETCDEKGAFPIGKARVLKEGALCTAVGYSHSVSTILNAELRSVEVIDLLTLKPMDSETVKKSVIKTGRLLCVEDVEASGSPLSSLISRLMEDKQVFKALKEAPIHLAAHASPVPFNKEAEMRSIPSQQDVNLALAKLLSAPHQAQSAQ